MGNEGAEVGFGIFGMVFLAWVLTYFIRGPPHWVQAFLFWLWAIPLIIALITLGIMLVAALVTTS